MTTATAQNPPAELRSRRSDEAIEVLRGTRDGDELAPRDLHFLEQVVNHGDQLTPEGVAYWDSLVARVRAGTYQPPWYWGIEHLTRDHSGYVYWKGREVDHFSYPHSPDGARCEKRAAQQRAAECRMLEGTGREVCPAELSRLWDRKWAGEGLPLRRFGAVWLIRQQRAEIAVVELSGATHQGLDEELSQVAADRAAQWGVAAEDVRAQRIVYREQFDVVMQCLQQEWDLYNRYWHSAPEGQYVTRLQAAVRAAVPVDALPMLEELEQQFLGPWGLPEPEEVPAPIERSGRERG